MRKKIDISVFFYISAHIFQFTLPGYNTNVNPIYYTRARTHTNLSDQHTCFERFYHRLVTQNCLFIIAIPVHFGFAFSVFSSTSVSFASDFVRSTRIGPHLNEFLNF